MIRRMFLVWVSIYSDAIPSNSYPSISCPTQHPLHRPEMVKKLDQEQTTFLSLSLLESFRWPRCDQAAFQDPEIPFKFQLLFCWTCHQKDQSIKRNLADTNKCPHTLPFFHNLVRDCGIQLSPLNRFFQIHTVALRSSERTKFECISVFSNVHSVTSGASNWLNRLFCPIGDWWVWGWDGWESRPLVWDLLRLGWIDLVWIGGVYDPFPFDIGKFAIYNADGFLCIIHRFIECEWDRSQYYSRCLLTVGL